jgi:transporter family-2 protein
MTSAVLMALLGGALVALSRQLNGRLAEAASPLGASAWNHAVGLLALLLGGAAWGLLPPAGLGDVPAWAWAGGPVGVLFVAAGAWLVPRIGAAATAVLVIAGQMLSGAILDTLRGAEGAGWRGAGVALILAGVALARR